jgi:hypothetical protein
MIYWHINPTSNKVTPKKNEEAKTNKQQTFFCNLLRVLLWREL